jgi:hypothetical protein
MVFEQDNELREIGAGRRDRRTTPGFYSTPQDS